MNDLRIPSLIELVKSFYLSTETANFIFHLDISDGSQISALFSSGRSATYGVGQDRIIQKYLEMNDYAVIAAIYPFILEETHLSGRTIFFCPVEMFQAVHTGMGMFQREFIEFGYLGFAVVPVSPLRQYVEGRLNSLGKTCPLTIKESSDLLWQFLSPNQRGAVHVWMRKGPVFRPDTYETKPSRRGCRLSMSDNVVIGLLAAMFRYGVRYSDFSRLSRPRSVSEIRFFDELCKELRQRSEES